jgi:hypothetical protein
MESVLGFSYIFLNIFQDDFSIADIRGIVVRRLEEIEAAEGPEDVREATRTLVRPSI